ncbi:hypothetical protein EXU30_04710 [Shewanella maritima]|uniref:Uncharacterized protein n=1 Tax=Shewanella maritima TaxID=2520507 RepID=A0A411PEW8_9GAMM|nr:hypothetical protein [Shewanella maritima]QBF82083.1 hypothetical protein EXU30_04710 [Shewanella maritima]
MDLAKQMQLALTIVLALLVIVYGAFWKFARDEVYFLCGNFHIGVSERSVLRQLDTAELSRYSIVPTYTGSTITFSSPINFSFYQCVINLDVHGQVKQAQFI